jgi:hypothetical protein
MTTLLSNPLAREILLGDQAYKVVISAEGVRIARKGARKGAGLKWDALLALGQEAQRSTAEPRVQTSDVPAPIAADIAKEVRVAADALTRARTLLANLGSVPASLLLEIEPDPVYGRADPATDWYIEPLLTPAEVASIMRVSRSAVRQLGIPSVQIAGEARYRQSELRRYLLKHQDM